MACEITFVSAPAGSGKTQRLANAYIELLRRGVEVGRILAITFTEKAAAEMKERILTLLEKNDPPRYRQLLEHILEMRVSTIDAFCLALIRRAAPLIGLNADLEVTTDDHYLREQAFQETVQKLEIRTGSGAAAGRLLDMITEGRFRGWEKFTADIHYLFKKLHLTSRKLKSPDAEIIEKIRKCADKLAGHPVGATVIKNYRDLFPKTWTMETALEVAGLIRSEQGKLLTKNEGTWRKQSPRGLGLKPAEYQTWLEQFQPMAEAAWQLESYRRAGQVLEIFQDFFLKTYQEKKKIANLLDFTDLPLRAYELVAPAHAESLNILYAFDEHTDHILIDEFQDTNFLQWGILKALSEEWLSGESWRDPNQATSLFMVGDEKQAIYYFRDANSEVFRAVPGDLRQRGLALREEKLSRNYRSRAAIIEFTNHLFSRVMSEDPKRRFRVGYLPLETGRKTTDPGRVELTLLEPAAEKESRQEVRGREAELASRRILSLVGKFQVSEKDETLRPARFRDCALLLRNRTNLKIFEAGFKNHAIPYTVVKGIGFYQSEEVCLLRFLIAFLADPGDNLALYTLLSSRLFRLQPADLLRLAIQPGPSWWQKLRAAPEEKNRAAVRMLEAVLARRGRLPLAMLIEEFLIQSETWKHYPLDPEQVNIKKFLAQLDQFAEKGLSLAEINDRLDRLDSPDTREAQANVLTEDLDAVQVFTIHSAKGLEFPIVFLPELDRNFKIHKSDSNLLAMELNPDEFALAGEADSALRKFHPLFQEDREKELEEERHLLYVAVTRARDALFLSGLPKEKTGSEEKSPLDWVLGAIDPENQPPLPGFRVAGAAAILAELAAAGAAGAEAGTPAPEPGPDLSAPLPAPPPASRPATDYLEEFRAVSGQARQLGTVIHQLLNEISLGRLEVAETAILERCRRLAYPLPERELEPLAAEAWRQVHSLMAGPAGPVIRPRPDGLSELPFVLNRPDGVIPGRMDRVIITADAVRIYDYKTGPVRSEKLAEAAAGYRPQLDIYRQAAQALFPGRRVETHLVFTAAGRIIPIEE